MTVQKKYIFALVSICFSFGLVSATNVEIDSLKSKLAKSEVDKRILIHIEIADLYKFVNSDSGLVYLNKASKLCIETGNEKQLAEIYKSLGDLHFNLADYPKAYYNFIKASGIFQKSNELGNEAKALSYAGHAQLLSAKYESALELYLGAFTVYEKNEDTSGVVYAYTSIGQLYHTLGEFDKAETNYLKAFELAEIISDSAAIARLWNNLGLTFLETQKLNEADSCFNLARDYFIMVGNTMTEISILNNIALLNDYSGNYIKASEIYNEIIYFSDSIGDRLGVAYAYSNLGDISVKNNSFTNAKHHYTISLELAFEMDKLDLIRNLYEKLSEVSYHLGKPDEALNYLEKYIVYKDSIFSIEKSNQILEMQSRFNIELKENEILLLQKEKDREELKRKSITMVLILTFIVTILIIILLRLKMIKNKEIRNKEKQLHQKEQALVNAELEKKTLKEKQLVDKISFADKQLTTSALNIIQKNELMIELKNKLENLSHEKTTDIKSLITYNFKLDKDWQEFQYYFEQVHKDFYLLLKKDYPGLSPTELKIAALIKLNFSIKQTGSIMGITSDSVKTYRSRIRKKLAMEQSDNLTEFLMNY